MSDYLHSKPPLKSGMGSDCLKFIRTQTKTAFLIYNQMTTQKSTKKMVTAVIRNEKKLRFYSR